MSKGMIGRSKQKKSDSYAAYKSHDEVYYQMASIFKQLAEEEEYLADEILTRLLLSEISGFPLEKSI